MPKTVYWHGGRGGMKKGQFILPPAITGAFSTAECGNHVIDTHKVYVTTDFMIAAMFAAGVPKGDVYQVVPQGTLEEDPDCNEEGMSFSCDRACIVRRHRLSGQQRLALVEALLKSDC